jgi:hypothetical protein
MKSGEALELEHDVSRSEKNCFHTSRVGEGMGAYLQKGVAKTRT